MKAPPQPPKSFRLTLELSFRAARLDNVLLEALRAQDRNPQLKAVSRSVFKKLFDDKKILIKGQSARPSSALAAGTTYVDILGYEDANADA